MLCTARPQEPSPPPCGHGLSSPRRSSLDSHDGSSTASSSGGSSSRGARGVPVAEHPLQPLGVDEACPLGLGLGGGGGASSQSQGRNPDAREAAAEGSGGDDESLGEESGGRGNDEGGLQRGLSHRAFRVHRSSSMSMSISASSASAKSSVSSNRRASADTSSRRTSIERKREIMGGEDRIRLARRSDDCENIGDVAISGSGSRESRQDAGAQADDGGGEDAALLRRQLAELRSKLDRTRSSLRKERDRSSALSKENRSLNRRLVGYRTECADKSSRIEALESQVDALRRGVDEAGTMERANLIMEEEQMRLEGRRLREERDRAILERNELMSRVGMMTVEVDEADVMGGDNPEHAGGSRRSSTGGFERLIGKVAKGGGRGAEGGHGSMPNMGSSITESSTSGKKLVVTPESLLWDSEDATRADE